MSKLSLLDKWKIVIELSKESKTFLVILSVLVVFGLILSLASKRNEKWIKKIYMIMTIGITILMIATYHSSLGKMMNYMMKNLFIVVYFPNIAVYLAAIIGMNVILWISIFNYKSSRQIRGLNIIIYIIMNYILALLLKVINTNKLDIFNQASIYGNKDSSALIGLSSTIFVVWIIFLIVYKLLLIYLKKDYKPKVKKIIIRKKVKKLPENYQPTTIPNLVYGKAPQSRGFTKYEVKNKNAELLQEMGSQFTLEDYKLFSKMLKEQKDASTEMNFSSKKNEIIPEGKENLVERNEQIVPKEEKTIIKVDDEDVRTKRKLTELEMLYRNVN